MKPGHGRLFMSGLFVFDSGLVPSGMRWLGSEGTATTHSSEIMV